MEEEVVKGVEGDPLDEPFNEATTLTQLAGSVSGRDLLDLRQEFAKEMKEQTSALREVQLVLLRFEEAMDKVVQGLDAQRTLLEGVRPAQQRKTSLDSLMEEERKSDCRQDVAPPTTCPPALHLPHVLQELDGSSRSVLQDVSVSETGTGAALSVVPTLRILRRDGVSGEGSPRRSSEPCLSPRRELVVENRPSVQSSGFSKSSGIQSRNLFGMTEELEGITASRIMKNKLHAGGRKGSRSVSSSRAPIVKEEESAPTSPRGRIGTMDGAFLNRRLSMDQLRMRVDEGLVRSATHKLGSSGDLAVGPVHALSSLSWAILCCSGILDWRLGSFWQIFSWLNFAVCPLGLVFLVQVDANLMDNDHYMPNTMMALTLGTVLSIGNLRWVGLGQLLGPGEHGLDDFAVESGFMEDWKRLSRRRSFEVLAVLVLMVTCRFVWNICFPSELNYGHSITGMTSDILMDIVFLCVSFRCAAVTFCQLHICSALELSIDSFCLKFFKEMDIEQAIHEWNMVQANLRKVSNECSGSFFLTAAACFAAMLLLAERILQDPTSIQDWRQITLWLGWLYPPVLFFFYAALRAAAVTEKASRVGPLVNSWNLQESDDEPSMDLDRQYVVQYINQSQAGFFMKGVRITGFEVQKMMYYFAALTFTLVSRTFTTR